MGQKDIITKKFMKQPEVFADTFNCFFYEGDPDIKPDQLRSLDPIETGSKQRKHYERHRDMLKYFGGMQDDENAYLLLGIENQSYIDYSMPVRNMGYDVLRYEEQIEQRRKKKDEKMNHEQPFGGLKSGEKLVPIVTLVVYFGRKPWDGPRSLHDILDIQHPELTKYIADYPLNVINLCSLSEKEIQSFQSDLQDVVRSIQCSGDKMATIELMKTERFQKMNRLTAKVINVVTNARIHLLEEKGDVVNMENAFDQLRQEWKAEGKAEGRAEGRAEVLVEKLNCLLQSGKFSPNEAMEVLQITAEEQEKIKMVCINGRFRLT